MSDRDQIDHDLFRRGEFLRLCQSSATPNAKGARCDVRFAVAAALSGDLATAERIAASCLHTSCELRVSAIAECVLGLVAAKRGDSATASMKFVTAVRTALDSNDRPSVAW